MRQVVITTIFIYDHSCQGDVFRIQHFLHPLSLKTLMFSCDHRHCIIASSVMTWRPVGQQGLNMLTDVGQKGPSTLTSQADERKRKNMGTKSHLVDMTWLIMGKGGYEWRIWEGPFIYSWYFMQVMGEGKMNKFDLEYILAISDFWNAGPCWVFEMF